jgi:hypothetical protein
MARIVVDSSNLTQTLLLYPGLGPAKLEQYRRSYTRVVRLIKNKKDQRHDLGLSSIFVLVICNKFLV